MMRSGAELQKSVHTVLSDDATLVAMLATNGIHDLPPARAAFPYLTFGRTAAFDWSTSTESGVEHLMTIHVWSQAKGKKEAQDILARVEAVLAATPPAPEGHHLALFRHEYSEVRYDEDALMHHGLLRYRALTEKTA